ncbi:hypothetical protein [Eisenibacter elegans]|jgi:hypothetical protein|uniref:hypothetical protein n=1 Tax=Eisenibacter elegans TaxID=997 RepID=UPI0004105B00|nr:hypothetical protein [Eisenibacter elegans]
MQHHYTHLGRLTFGLVLLLSTCLSLQAQNLQYSLYSPPLKVKFGGAELLPEDNIIRIRYDLHGSKRRAYITRLYYSNNNGNSFKGPLRALEGDTGDSTFVGSGKEVRWAFLKDNPYFNGENISFRIEATEIPKEAKGTEINALWSLLIPGLGDAAVRNGYNYAGIGVATYGLLGAGLGTKLIARQRYRNYTDRVPNTEEEHRRLFRQANSLDRTGNALLIASAAIWLGDVVGVYLKGRQNRKKYFPKNTDNADGNTAHNQGWQRFRPNVQPYMGPYQDNGLLLVWKF